MAGLTPDQKRIANFCEQTFWSTGELPTSEAIAETLEVDTNIVRRCWNNDLFRKELVVRGIDFDTDKSKGILSGKQLLVANMILNLTDKRSIRAKLKEAEVTEQQYNAWQRDANFAAYLRRRAEAIFNTSDHDAYLALVETVRGGDVPALKLFFEMRGIYSPKVDINVNVEFVLTRVVEIVAKYVKDPVVLDAIATELEVIDTLPPGISLPGKSSISGFRL